MLAKPAILSFAAVLVTGSIALGADPSALAEATFSPAACNEQDPRIYADIDSTHPFCAWVEQLAKDTITQGCGSGNYCPDNPVTRAQLAMLLEKVMRGTSSWFAGTHVTLACVDLGQDCTVPAGQPLSMAAILDDPVYPTGNHLLRVWFSTDATYPTVTPVDSLMLPSAASLYVFVPNGHALWMTGGGGNNFVFVIPTMNTPTTRYMNVEYDGRIFTSPLLTWN